MKRVYKDLVVRLQDAVGGEKQNAAVLPGGRVALHGLHVDVARVVGAQDGALEAAKGVAIQDERALAAVDQVLLLLLLLYLIFNLF